MRKEKYNPEYYGDDIGPAFSENKLGHVLKDIDVIVAEICGQNDEYSWYWILLMKDGKYAHAEGSCDYSGWDCQSSAYFKTGFKTAKHAVDALEVPTWEKRPLINETLLQQINDEVPFGVYIS